MTILEDFETVYGSLADPANWPHCANGLCAMQHDAVTDTWTTQQESSVATIVFTPKNDFGVLDHHVALPDGSIVTMPVRAIRKGVGTEVILTLIRLPEMDDATWR